MLNPSYVAAALLAANMLMPATPAAAIDGEVLITDAKAVAGNVTPGDTKGYPVTISRTGSYKLASNLQVPANNHGILVTATEVSIDLNGFRMSGGKVALNGIIGTQRGLTVRNGTINFFKNGIDMRGALLTVENMRIEENGIYGVAETTAATGFSRIVDSIIFGNGTTGIVCRQGCHIEGNNISKNGVGLGGYGVQILTSGTVLGNTIVANGSFGIITSGKVGFGNNTIIDNATGSVSGNLIQLHPNACSPAC